MREPVEVAMGWAQIYPLQRFNDKLASSLPGAAHAVYVEWLFDDLANPEPRVQRFVRILVDDLHVLSQRTQLTAREARDVLAAEQNGARCRVDQT
jgi:hypothetical protein